MKKISWPICPPKLTPTPPPPNANYSVDWPTVCHLVLSDPDGFTMQAGGPAGAFMAPMAREHGVPGVAAVGIVAAVPHKL